MPGWCNGPMTTTLGDTSGTRPPVFNDLLRELQELKKREGITPAKVRRDGANLQRLPISRDEYARTQHHGVDLAIATVEALKCVVNSYRTAHPVPGEAFDQRWVVLNHELNLEAAFHFNLGDRQLRARADLGDLGEKQYESRSSAIIEAFAVKLLQLVRSLCWTPGEWEANEAARINKLPESLRERAIFAALMCSAATFNDRAAPTPRLGDMLPNLSQSLPSAKGRKYPLPKTRQLFFDAVVAVGRQVYDPSISTITDVLRSSQPLLLPFDVIIKLVTASRWPTNSDYAYAAEAADQLLRDAGYVPVWFPPRYRKDLFLDGKRFFNYQDTAANDLFMDGLEQTARLLARIVVRIDRYGLWRITDYGAKGIGIDVDYDAVMKIGIAAFIDPDGSDTPRLAPPAQAGPASAQSSDQATGSTEAGMEGEAEW